MQLLTALGPDSRAVRTYPSMCGCNGTSRFIVIELEQEIDKQLSWFAVTGRFCEFGQVLQGLQAFESRLAPQALQVPSIRQKSRMTTCAHALASVI